MPGRQQASDREPKIRGGSPARILTLGDAADLMGLSRVEFLAQVEAGELPKPIRFDGLVRWDAVRLVGSHVTLFDDPQYHIVYVVGFGTYVKIGFTTGPLSKRIAGLQTGCPERLQTYAELEGNRHLEARLHARFSAYHTYGDWFRREGDLAEWIDAGCPL